MFCPKCGEKNKEGAQFCVKCGEKFDAKKEGEKKKTAAKKNTKIDVDDVKDAAVEVTKEMTVEASNIVKDMVVAPIDSLKKYGDEKRFSLSLVLVGIMSILVGIFAIAATKTLYASIMELARSYMGSFMYYASTGADANIPYAKIFFYSLIATFALSFIFVGILYLVNNYMFKGKDSFKKMFVIYSIISIVVSATLLVTTVLAFISVKLAAIILSLGLTLSTFYTYHMIRLIGPKDENKHGYIYVVTTILFYLAAYIIFKVII